MTEHEEGRDLFISVVRFPQILKSLNHEELCCCFTLSRVKEVTEAKASHSCSVLEHGILCVWT